MDKINIESVLSSSIQRLIAVIIDFVVIILVNTLVSSIVVFVLNTVLKINIDLSSFGIATYIPMVTFLIVSVIYSVILELSRWQGTVGKRMLKVKVTDYEGNKLSFSACWLRNIFKVITIVSMIGCLSIYFTAKRQMIHDLLAKSMVISYK